MRSLLFDVSPWDAGVFGGSALLLSVCVGAAALIPAWRAMRIEPAESLRST